MTQATRIAVVVSHRVGLTTAQPYVQKLIESNCNVNVYCLGDFFSLAVDLMPWSANVISQTDIHYSARMSRLINKAIFSLSNFSRGLNREQNESFEHRSLLGRKWRLLALAITKRLPPQILNRLISLILSRGKSQFEEDQIWVISFLTDPLILRGHRKRPIVTIIDSWDHPVRKTAGYRTTLVIGWNRDLAEDWKRVQGADRGISGIPAKLLYAHQAFPVSPSDDRIFMFAVGTSSHTCEWERGELALADVLAAAAMDAGWKVLLKIKPTGGQESWISFASERQNCELSSAIEAASPMDYFLDSTYNVQRIAELERVNFVINTVSTFGLDAAIAGMPVLQVAGLGGSLFAGLASAQKNFHLQKYLIAGNRDLLHLDQETCYHDFKYWLENQDDRHHLFSAQIRSWIAPKLDVDSALTIAIEDALKFQKVSGVGQRFVRKGI